MNGYQLNILKMKSVALDRAPVRKTNNQWCWQIQDVLLQISHNAQSKSEENRTPQQVKNRLQPINQPALISCGSISSFSTVRALKMHVSVVTSSPRANK